MDDAFGLQIVRRDDLPALTLPFWRKIGLVAGQQGDGWRAVGPSQFGKCIVIDVLVEVFNLGDCRRPRQASRRQFLNVAAFPPPELPGFVSPTW